MALTLVPKRPRALVAALGAALLTVACGGGGSDNGNEPLRPASNPNPNPPRMTCSDAGLAAARASALPAVVCMLTSDGEIVVELDSTKAPITVANFLKYVNAKFYDNTLFHRVVPGFVAQGGGFLPGGQLKPGASGTIKLETNVGLSNARGTIAMARGDTADSAISEFYFNVADNNVVGNANNLDYRSASSPGYAVFGRVISGLGTVDAINAEKQLGAGYQTPATEVLLYWAIQVK